MYPFVHPIKLKQFRNDWKLINCTKSAQKIRYEKIKKIPSRIISFCLMQLKRTRKTEYTGLCQYQLLLLYVNENYGVGTRKRFWRSDRILGAVVFYACLSND